MNNALVRALVCRADAVCIAERAGILNFAIWWCFRRCRRWRVWTANPVRKVVGLAARMHLVTMRPFEWYHVKQNNRLDHTPDGRGLKVPRKRVLTPWSGVGHSYMRNADCGNQRIIQCAMSVSGSPVRFEVRAPGGYRPRVSVWYTGLVLGC